jgi:hypothetical protein
MSDEKIVAELQNLTEGEDVPSVVQADSNYSIIC